jgi:hypothetical protein
MAYSLQINIFLKKNKKTEEKCEIGAKPSMDLPKP